ncbi:MAG: non-ribosomal peptide synthase/polyketide synthase, partial [candidate division KSB1 bacterium]|nr:non-ribosomal peptide synthase/polyketide synthase [candidate division KSB1 bacterium]
MKIELLWDFCPKIGYSKRGKRAIKTGKLTMSENIQNISEQDVYVFPTSYAQQRLWFLDQFEPNSPFYNIPSAVRFKGQLNVAALEQSINEVVRRHETLRTTFTRINGKPMQVIHPFSWISIPVEDLRHLAVEEREAEAIRLAKLEARTPFNLTTGPLVRIKLIKLDERDHLVLFTMHHIISDGWSVGVLIREISILYNAFINNQPVPLPELPIQYADFAVWQQEYLTGEVLEKQLDYWKNQLNGRYGKLQILELPSDRPRPAIQTSNGDTVEVTFPGKLIDQLKVLSSQEGATFFMTLLAAFQTLLYRYTGLEDIAVGSPIANRNRPEIEDLIGFFVNTLVLRTNLAGDPTFRELLQRVREVTLGAYSNQDIPFERLVELVQPERDMSHSPLFQVMFILQNNPMNGGVELPDVSLSTLDINAGTSTFDLTLMVTEQMAGASVSLEYNTDLFDQATMLRLLRHYRELLEGIVANPEERISRLPILPAPERQQVLVEWNNYQADYPTGLCIHQLFEAQAAFTPEATAVAFDGQYLTYQELNERANQLAHYLRKRGVQPEKLVGICAEKSLELIVGVMGTLKAGGAYVPIDPTYPKDRIAHMLQDSKVTVLLTQQRIVPDLPENAAEIICLDSDWEQIAKESTATPTLNVTPDNLVYVIYTSGSTGKSKGVMVMHRTLVNQYQAWEETFRLRTDATSHLQMASFSFDVFSGDLARALCSGGKLVLVPRDLLLEADKLYQLMLKEKVDIAEFVPAVLRNLVQYLDNSGQTLEFMKVLIAGSDVWYVGEYKKFMNYCGPQTRLLNTFGLTEATIDSSYFESQDLNLSLERLVPIGIPFNNTKIYILDQHTQPVPIGVPGELCVGGAGLARGYLNRPELTAEKFIPNPYSGIPGDRLYRTGDRARFLADGNIEFLGRIDNQVKIRGFRIELGEIESVLGKHDQVKEVAVTAREDAPGSKRLVAYIVSKNGVQPTVGEFHSFLKEQLPDYMVPSYFVFLDAMPLTPNGKIDRKALPAPDQESAAVSATEYVAPRTPTEEKLARIWSQVLGVEKIGVNDNFFELGGHSLLATQLVSRIRDEFEIELPLRSIFEVPFVAELAKKIDIAKLSEPGLEAPPIVPISRDQELPLSFAQQRLWFLDQLEPNSPFYNIPEAVRFKGHLDVDALEQSLNEVVRRHESLRTTFHAKGGKPYQVIHPEMTIPLRKIDLRRLPREDRESHIQEIARQEGQTPFDLTIGPLLRATLVQVDADDYVVFYTMHHIIGDDWSTTVLVREITLCYDAFTHQRPSPLPELPIQYADFAYWQQQWLQGEVLEAQLNYWKQQLAGAPQRLELPTDRPRPPVQTFNGSYKTFRLSESLSQAIKELCNREGTTLFMTLLAAFQTLMYRYSGQDDIAVGSPIANRTRAELENIVGFFVNTLVFRTDLSGRPTFKELLQRVRNVALGAYAHQDLPFEKLVDAIQPQRDLSHSPLFQVMFVIQNVPGQPTNVSGVTISPVENHSGTSKFDLTMFMLEEGNNLAGALEYNTDLFDETTIDRMLRHFENLLAQVVAAPEMRIDQIPLLTAAERDRAIIEWNATHVDYPHHQFVHRLFESQVNQTPHAPAVVFGVEQLTYLELNQAANQLARHLRKLGVDRETLVGIYMERSLEVMVGMLGVLKAGAAYVPIDPSYPQERIAYMLEDAKVMVVLTQERLLGNLPARLTGYPEKTVNAGPAPQLVTICLDCDWGSIANENDENLDVELTGENLAYVIYTSGSTGKPKGTMISHRSLMNYLFWCLKTYPLKEGRGALVHSSLAFDATITGLYAPLLVGHAVYLTPETKDIEIVARTLQEYRNFSLVKITPAHLKLLGQQVFPENAADLVKAFIIGGENLTTEHIAFWLKYAPATKLINEYGPTETVVGCMNYDTPHDFQKVGSVPIGSPIGNMQIYLLDQHLEPVPIGVAGEMFIGGVGVARGYLNRPELTAEKFIPDPFGQEPGARLYRTGDLARYLSDGNIEFLGRIDNQVKIRGFRIELGEIEAVLGQHPAIKENVVIDWQMENDVRLVAYIVPVGETMPSLEELRDFLKEKLPEYMIPAAFIQLDEIPLTANAKVDRRALPTPEISRSDMKKEYVAPRTHTERELAKIWLDLIKIDRVGIHDTFFELGGHSLLATQLISRVREHFKVELPLITVFEAPTLSAFAERIERAKLAAGPLEMPPIEPIPRHPGVELELSFTQQRLWFLDQLDPGQSFYNIPSSVRLKGKLNLLAFERSILEVIRRHEILRTRFAAVKGRPIMVIAPEPDFSLPQVDLTMLSEAEREAEISRLANEDASRPFNLATGPLFRATLLKLADDEHVVLFTMHHIISDGWSVNILLQEMGILYNAFSQGQPSPLPELPIQYADYAHWLRNWLTGEVLENQLLYWKKKLANIPALLELPTDRPRPAIKTFNGSLRSFEISKDVSDKLYQLGQEHGVTLFMTLLAAFKTLLHRYAGQTDISVGTPIANRTRQEVENLIGFFANTLVLRTDLSGDPSFVELLKRVKGVCLGAYQNQDVPFEKLVEMIQPERDLSHTPLFQVMFVLQNNPQPSIETSDIQMIPIMAQSGTTQFDLTMSVEETGDGLGVVLEYNTDLFDGTTIDEMVAHFQVLLQGAVTQPEQPISLLPMLTDEEKHRFLIEWNHTGAAFPDQCCIHELFEAQVERTPDAIAVVFEGQQLTYRELNARANQLANFLREQGIGPDKIVGISVERSIEMVVGLLGIMKAGGAYLPIDPNYPKDRIGYMLLDAGMSILLTQERLLPNFPADEIRIVCLDRDWGQIASYGSSNLTVNTTPDNLAYMIYTSGSTGRPKGVMLHHRGLCNLTHSQIQDFAVTSASRVLQFASFSFDASVSEIFMALLTGARLYLASSDTLMSMPQLIRLLQAEEITTVTLPPSLLRILPNDNLPALETIISAGEACTKDIARRWASDRRLINAYGPTESTIGVTSYRVTEISEQGMTIPIGRPIQNVQLYILDRHMNPVPRGVKGELFIGGIGLARGYYQRPDLTAEKFIPNPFSSYPGARLYRTGDLARFLPDGNIEFLGRIDQQVKVRGFRIELGEIESAISQHPAIQDVVVLALDKGEAKSIKQLVAYIVSTTPDAPTVRELRDFLKDQLPEYMIPTAFVRLEKLPLLPNGKIDRKALPEPEAAETRAGQAYVAPRTPTEEILASIWSQMLEVEQIGVYDNFFELGGHSLIATQLMSRIRDTFDVELPIRHLFETPHIAYLSQVIDTARMSLQMGLKREIPKIERISRDQYLPLSFAQQRLWFLDQLEAGTAAYNLPAAVRLTGDLNIAALESSLNEIVKRHESLRTTFSAIEGKAIQVIAPELKIALPVIDLTDLPPEDREIEALELARAEAQRPFDLTKGPLLRVHLVRMDEQNHIVLFTMHHIISDGWSMGVLIREVAILYEAFSQGLPSPLPELPIQYADFAFWQREWLKDEVLEAQVNFWKQQLAGSQPLLELPTDRPRPPLQTYNGNTLAFSLPAELSQAIKALSQAEGATLFMTLLASLQTLLYRYTGQDDINVGTPIANRNRSETESLIGFFVNTLVMRGDLSGDPSFKEVLRRVREMALGAYAHQDLPFEMLVDIIQPKRNMSHTPLFQVMFVLQNLPLGSQKLPDLTLSPVEAETGIAKFDLTVSMVEQGEELAGSFEYNTDLFDTETIESMIEHFKIMLEGIVANPEQPISTLPFLAEAERKQLLYEWNDTSISYPQEKCIHEIVELQVAKNPEAVAVTYENQFFTYGELNARANQLARYLKRFGVGPDVLVGMYMERTLDMVVAILGILKAGGAYVPMDPVYPADRIAFMLEDTQTPVLLTQAHMLDKLPQSQAQVLCLDSDWEKISQESTENLPNEATPEHLAYVIFTSGSTGKPKGCMITHANVVRLFEATDEWYHFDERDVWTFFHSYAFDFSVWEIWGAFFYGGRLVVVPYLVSRSPEAFYQLLCRERVTVLNQTPSAFRQLIRAEETVGQSPDLALRLIIFGGEALEFNSLRPWYDRHGDQQPLLVNMYGITETTVHVTYRPLRLLDLETAPGSVIGIQIPDLQVYILNEHLEPVPVGVPGELYVGGAGVARGYLNRPDLTAQKFIANPFSDKPGDRLYRTGDLGRYLRDG